MIDVALDGKPFVIVSMDETALASVRHTGVGMIAGQLRAARRRYSRPRDPVDRMHTKISHLAAVVDNCDLQPLIPQIVLAKYSQHRRPPASVLDELSGHGFPLEFWHGTNGCVNVAVLLQWATRLRSVIHSWNNDAWILLLMDCASVHLSAEFTRHLRRLGILVVLVPAKLTWKLQVLDVSVFGPLKAEMRLEESRARARSPSGTMDPGTGARLASDSIRRMVVNHDWSRAFRRLGAGHLDEVELCSDVSATLSEADWIPALPTLAEFAEMSGRNSGTALTRRLHHTLIEPALEASRLGSDVPPKRGAFIDLPFNIAAGAGVVAPSSLNAMGYHRRIMREYLSSRSDRPFRLSGDGPARHVFFVRPEDD